MRASLERGNPEVGGSVIEMGEAEYMVRATGYLESVEDLEQILKADLEDADLDRDAGWDPESLREEFKEGPPAS